MTKLGLFVVVFLSVFLAGCVSNSEKKAYVKGCANGIVAVLAMVGAQPAYDKINQFCEKESQTLADPRP